MTLLFIDGFDAGDMTQKWTSTAGSTSNTTFPAGRFGGLCAYGKWDINRGIPASAQVIVGCAYNHGVQSTSVDLIRLYGDAGSVLHLTLRYIPTTGTFQLLRGGTVLVSSAAGVLPPQAWGYIEAKATIADAGGICIVRLGGTEIINFTGDTKNAGTNSTIDTVWFRYDGGNGGQSLDDVYIANSLGTTNNDFLGDVRVQTVVPTGAGSNTALTPSSGANWAAVDELPYSASDYVSGSAVGARDTYATSDIGAGYAVFGVQVNAVAMKTDAAVRNLKTVVRSSGTDYVDAAGAALTGTDRTVVSLRESNPAGGAWTAAAVNAMEIGVEVA